MTHTRIAGDRFPLYSKGVERYRFEYAVFLLNKDIEMVSPRPSSNTDSKG